MLSRRGILRLFCAAGLFVIYQNCTSSGFQLSTPLSQTSSMQNSATNSSAAGNSPAGATGSSSTSGSSNSNGSGSSVPASLSGKVISPKSANVPAGYKLTFSDEFTTLSVSDNDGDKVKWFTNTVAGCMDSTADLVHPNANTYMGLLSSKVNPFSIVPGVGLDIALTYDPTGWYGGMLSTIDNNGDGFSQTYGYFEMRAKLPVGSGTWPAFWMVPMSSHNTKGITGHGSEIDIFEHYSQWPTALNITLHDWATPPQPNMPSKILDFTQAPFGFGSIEGSFHLFGMLWTASTMTFYVDNVAAWSTPTPSFMNEPQFMIIDLGLGGAGDNNNISRNIVQFGQRADMIVDYVRAYSP